MSFLAKSLPQEGNLLDCDLEKVIEKSSLSALLCCLKTPQVSTLLTLLSSMLLFFGWMTLKNLSHASTRRDLLWRKFSRLNQGKILLLLLLLKLSYAIIFNFLE